MVREIKAIDDLAHDYNVNEYTIRYDTNTQRFFKAFAPKAGYGAITSGLVFAGLGIATVATGGLFGLGLGAVAGVAVATGAISQSIYSGFIYARNSSKARFKNMGIGGKPGAVGTIELVEQTEKEAASMAKMLEEQPNTKEFTVDGKKYSRNALKREIKEKEDVAYHGLKFLLQQGLLVSDKINSLTKRNNRSAREEESLEKYYGIMDRIAECTSFMASQRSTYNPYKNLIIDNMTKGCLVGFNDQQNNQIRLLRSMKDKDNAFKLYSNMYEMPIREYLVEQRHETLEAEREIQAQYKDNLSLVEQLIALDFDINKIQESNQEQARELLKYKNYMALIQTAKNISNMMPMEMSAEKILIGNTIKAFKTAISENNADEMANQASALDVLIQNAQAKINNVYYNKGNLARKAEFDKLFKSYQELGTEKTAKEEELKKERASHTSTKQKLKDSYAREAKAQQLVAESMADAMELAKAEKAKLDKAAEQILKVYSSIKLDGKPIIANHIKFVNQFHDSKKLTDEDREQYWLSLNKLNEALTDRRRENVVHILSELRQFKAERDEASKYAIEGANEARTNAVLLEQEKEKHAKATKRAWAERGKRRNAENKVTQAEDDLEYAMSGWYDAENAKRDAFATIDKQANEIKLNLSEVNKLKSQLTDSQKAIEEQKKRADYAEKQTTSANNKFKKAEKKASAEKVRADVAESNVERLKGEKADLERKLGESEDHNAQLVKGQSKNIERIMDLETQKSDLITENEFYRSTSETLAWDLYNMESKLDGMTNDRDAYRKGFEDSEDEKRKLETQLKDAEDRANELQSNIDYKNYKRDLGGAIKRLRTWINKADAHATVTQITKQSTNKDVRIVMESVDMLRTQDLNNMSIDELQTKRDALKVIYDASKTGLLTVDSTELSEMGKKLGKIIDKKTRDASKYGPLKPDGNGGWKR